jgi:CDP-diacylglycerol---glycerol-3-phosphate 3-phosphatidyltransferase
LKKHIPNILLHIRLFIACIIFAITSSAQTHSNALVLTLLYIGIISDIFDGIIARKLSISTQQFRVKDTLFDFLFYISIVYYIFSIQPSIFLANKEIICIIFSLEFCMYALSLLRFGKFPSPHAILSKFWGIYLVIEFSLLLFGVTGTHFTIALLCGILVHLDRVFIYLLLNQWDHDIPSSYHALLLRQGKQIHRLKIFNG